MSGFKGSLHVVKGYCITFEGLSQCLTGYHQNFGVITGFERLSQVSEFITGFRMLSQVFRNPTQDRKYATFLTRGRAV